MSMLTGGDRRMEAENYLAGGYGIRLALKARATGWSSMGQLANVWQPSRLKGIQVAREFGTPFLAATQVFDLHPVPRKFLSLDRTDSSAQRFVTAGMILVTCSGSVGRATLAHKPHENVLISHDLLRVEANDPKLWGWIYAFLRSPQARAMMSAAQYGHIIKHLDVSHLDTLPVPVLRDDLLAGFSAKAKRILDLRINAHEKSLTAETQLAQCFPSLGGSGTERPAFEVAASRMFHTRRRLDACRFVPSADAIDQAFRNDAKSVDLLRDVTSKVFVPGRFKHVYGAGGMPYLDSADILEVSPDVSKFVLSLSPQEQMEYYVQPGWLLMPCSGQVYGNVGHTVLATEWYVGKVLTNHIMRIAPNTKIRSGYLQCVMEHPKLGRPRIVRFAFGSSVPEIAAGDVAGLAIPRLDDAMEQELADLMEASAVARDSADALEHEIGLDAEARVDQFLTGDTTAFVIP